MWRALLALVLLVSVIWLAGGAHLSPAAAHATEAVVCSYPGANPVFHPSDCSLLTALDVAAGKTLQVSLTSPPNFALMGLSAGSCARDPPSGLSSSLVLLCPDGLAAGSTLSVTIATRHPGPFAATADITYNSGGTDAVTEAVSLMSEPPAPQTVRVQQGWNLIGGPSGTVASDALGPLYTYQAGDSAYEVLPPGTELEPGVGYWAYFPALGSIMLPGAIPGSLTVPLPAGQWIIIGNPFQQYAVLRPESGATLTAETYDPTTGRYETVQPTPCCDLPGGRGAWVYSPTAGAVVISAGAIP